MGRVFGEVGRRSDGVFFQMFAEPRNSEWNTIVGYGDTALQIKEDDYVHVTGAVSGSQTGQNALGGSVRAIVVIASKVEVVDALAAAPPALRKSGGASQTQHGVSVTLEAVEFAAEETRVILVVTNGSGQEARFYDFNAKAIQGDRQFEPDRFGTDYPEVQSELLPGVKSRGVIVFPPIPSGSTTFQFEARLDDFSVDFTPYQFKVTA